MIPEAVVSCYAIASLGAVIVPLFSGLRSRRDRGTNPGCRCRRRHRRRRHDPAPADGRNEGSLLTEALETCPSVRQVIVVDNVGQRDHSRPVRRAWNQLLASDGRRRSRRGRAQPTCCCSPTPREPPVARRAPSTPTRGSWSRRPARSRTPSMSDDRRSLLLDHRHGLDHGPAVDHRNPRQRRNPAALRGRARCSRPRSAVGPRRAPPGHHARGLARHSSARCARATPSRYRDHDLSSVHVLGFDG